jgi:hypothetical protein
MIRRATDRQALPSSVLWCSIEVPGGRLIATTSVPALGCRARLRRSVAARAEFARTHAGRAAATSWLLDSSGK